MILGEKFGKLNDSKAYLAFLIEDWSQIIKNHRHCLAVQSHILFLFRGPLHMKQSFRFFSILVSIVMFSVIVMTSQELLVLSYAEEYNFVAGIHNEITFHFRDGTDTVNFPVFSTTSDMVSNAGTSFEVEGVVGNNLHLHKAIDEAYVHRLSTLTAGSAYEFNYRYFNIDVNIVQNENILKSLSYKNCEISEYGISTINDDYESYLVSDSGFAIVNSINFRCGGVHLNVESDNSKPAITFTDYGSLPFALAEDVRTFLTFEFDNGAEKIESVIFILTSGFNESANDGASFQIITAVLPHTLIDDAIDKSMKVSGLPSSFNEDFDVSIEFVNSEQTLRGLDFKDCIMDGYQIVTLRDKEEGYTGKRGFTTAEILDVDCSGLKAIIPYYNEVSGTTASSLFLSSNIEPSYNMGTGPHIITTFDFDSSIEVVEFPEFYQDNLIARANPTFQLVGVPDVTPMLYDAVDKSRLVSSKSTGFNSLDKLFDVNLVLVYRDKIVRGFDYSQCRIVDYIIKTEHDGEESFYNGFALTNEFHFECTGYTPYDPVFDSLTDTPKAKTESSKEYQNRQNPSWGMDFQSH